MSDSPSIALAFAAGVVSFVSPCCLPLVPGYLATVGGMRVEDVGLRVDARVLARSLLFVGTFSAVFVLLGLGATSLGGFLFESQPLMNKVAGAAIAAMGLLFLASAFVTRLNREWRPPGLIERARQQRPSRGRRGVRDRLDALCRSDTRGDPRARRHPAGDGRGCGAARRVLRRARRPRPARGSRTQRGGPSFRFLKRHWPAVQAGSGAVLIGMGILVLTGELFRFNSEIQQVLDGLGINFFQGV